MKFDRAEQSDEVKMSGISGKYKMIYTGGKRNKTKMILIGEKEINMFLVEDNNKS